MTTYQDIQPQTSFKLLIIGDACVDEYIYGTVDRLSPEAPVPVFVEKSRKIRPGMVGNVVNNIKNMLPSASLTLHQNQEELVRKTRFIDTRSNYQIMRHDVENSIAEIRFSDLSQQVYDAIVISDYDKGYVTSNFVSDLTDFFKCPIFVDTKKSNLSIFKNCVIKINEKEYNKAHHLHETSRLIVTLGSNGAMYLGKKYPVDPVVVHDVCGAGDVFLSSLVARFLETMDMEKSINTANRCAAYSVTKHGTYAINRDEYENLCI